MVYSLIPRLTDNMAVIYNSAVPGVLNEVRPLYVTVSEYVLLLDRIGPRIEQEKVIVCL